MFSRRSALALMAVGGAIPALASCGPSTGSQDNDALRVYWWGSELRHGQTTEVLDLYAEEHPDVEISPEYSEWSGYWDKLATQTAGGAAPEIFQMDEAYIDSYGNQGSLLDLDTISETLDLSTMDEAILETGRLADGSLVGAPNGFNLYSTGMNPVVLEEAGIDLPDDTTWTWEDFFEICQQVSEWGRSNGQEVFGTNSFGLGEDDLATWARQTGNQQLFPREGEELVTKDTIVELLEFTRRFTADGVTPDPSSQIEDGSIGLEQGRFATNRSAFQQVPSSQILAFQDASGSPLKLLRTPARTSGEALMVNKASMYWSIAQTASDPERAAELTNFLLLNEEVATILKIERGIPAFPQLREAVRPLLTEDELVSLDFAEMMQEEVVDPPVVTPASGVGFGEEYSRLAEDSLFESRSTSEVADEILEVLTSMQPDG